MEPLIVSAAFLLGFAGSLHCFGMCGPIAFAIAVDRNHRLKMVFQNLVYQLGRIVSYIVLGLLFGLIGYGFSLAGFQKTLSLLLGLSMIGSVFLSKNKKFLGGIGLFKPYALGLSRLRSALGGFIRKKTFSALFTTGVLNGLLPCGLVYAAITAAMSTGKVLSSGLFMLCFGIGTAPLMFATVMIGNFISLHVRNRVLRIIPIVVFLVGVLLILRGLGLGLPYVSPMDEALRPKERHQGKAEEAKPSPSYHCH